MKCGKGESTPSTTRKKESSGKTNATDPLSLDYHWQWVGKQDFHSKFPLGLVPTRHTSYAPVGPLQEWLGNGTQRTATTMTRSQGSAATLLCTSPSTPANHHPQLYLGPTHFRHPTAHQPETLLSLTKWYSFCSIWCLLHCLHLLFACKLVNLFLLSQNKWDLFDSAL